MQEEHQAFIREVVEMAANNALSLGGGPFGALVVKDGVIIGKGVNKVTTTNDPTAHAEVTAIRDACKNLSNYQLNDAVIYTSCEPCPMCLSAIYWARIRTIYYAARSEDAAAAGFDDSFIFQEISLPAQQRKIAAEHIPVKDFDKPFRKWKEVENKTTY